MNLFSENRHMESYPAGVSTKTLLALYSRLGAQQEEIKKLRELSEAACAFIDSHRADSDLSEEMITNYARFLDARAALAP